MPTVQQLTKRQRAEIAAADEENLKRLADAYVVMYNHIEGSADALVLAIEKLDNPTPAQVKALPEYKRLDKQMQKELDKFTSFTEVTIESAALVAVGIGLAHSQEWIKYAGGSVTGITPKVMIPLLDYLRRDGPLYERLSLLTGATVDKVTQSIIEGVGLGYNPRKIAAGIQDAFGGGLTDALRNTRTVQIYSYRDSARANYMASGGIVEGWIWFAELDGDTCAACIAEHGTLHDNSETLDGHYNCVLPDTFVQSVSLPSAVVTRNYKGQAITIKTLSGKFLSITPNHPILTSRGWVAAKDIQLGDYVISHAWDNGTAARVDPYKYHSPATIEDIFFSLRMDGITSVPSSPKDFHGDGMQGEINVIRPTGKLRNKFFAAFGEPLFEEFFSGRDFEIIGLAPQSHFDKSQGISWITANRIMGGDGIPTVLLGRAIGHHDSVRFGVGSEFNIVSDQDLTDNVTRYAETLGDRIFRFSPFVSPDNILSGKLIPDRVVSIDSFFYDGHVYNLETKNGWYISNGIITHNCRCAPIPYIPGLTDEIQTGEEWFNGLDETSRSNIMGKEVYGAYNSGAFTLQDMVKTSPNDVYGQMKTVTPLYELLGAEKPYTTIGE
jgi:hypothetical protein